jgi:hypothetical protein
MAVAASHKSPTTENYVSSIDFINQRNIDPKFFEKYPGQGLMKLMELMGRTKVTPNVKYEWAEEDRIFQTITVNANVAAPGAGSNLVITLSSGDHRDSGKNSYPRLHQLVILPNKKMGQVTAKSTAVDSAHTITIKPLRAADDLGAVTAGDKIIFHSNAYPEGADQYQGLTPIPLTYSNVVQIFKEDYIYTSTQAASKSWFEVKGPDGKVGYKWTFKGEKDTFTRFQTSVGLGILINEKADTTYTNGNSEITRTTEGMMPWVRTNGNNYVAAGFNMATMDNIIKKIDKQKGSKSNLFFQGIDLSMTVDNFLTSQMKNDVSNYEFFSAPGMDNKIDDQKQRAAMFGFDHFKKGTYTFHMMVLPEFNEENLLGTDGYGYSNTGLIVPTDKKVVTVNGQKESEYSFCIRYLEGRDYEHFIYGGGTGIANKTNGEDLVHLAYRCEKGFHGIAGNRYTIIED